MSGNCLVTKLKDVVNDASLLKLNEVRIQFGGNANDTLYLNPFTSKEEVSVSVVGQGKIKKITEDDSAYRTTISWSTGEGFEIVSQNNLQVTLSIISKFNIENLVGSSVIIKCADWKYSTDLKVLRATIDDDLQSLPKSIVTLQLKNKNNIDVQPILTFTNLTDFSLLVPTWVDFSLLAPKSLQNLNTYSTKWSSPTNRPSDAYIFSMYTTAVEGAVALGDDLDNMLANFANCIMPDKDIVINVYGTKTDETDNLAAALKAHAGARLTLKVNNVAY